MEALLNEPIFCQAFVKWTFGDMFEGVEGSPGGMRIREPLLSLNGKKIAEVLPYFWSKCSSLLQDAVKDVDYITVSPTPGQSLKSKKVEDQLWFAFSEFKKSNTGGGFSGILSTKLTIRVDKNANIVSMTRK